ncbi:hypothetical protein F947_01476 [Acinetobacter towneri DSM 14962 = CIP 107472]|nr:hypothetical protein F947_01476 [Acinetobacter towneri DSM 14962 = CIP 107472]
MVLMDLIVRFFVWVANCFLSGKAKACAFAVLGMFLSYLFLKIAPLLLKVALIFNPNLELYIFNNLMAFEVGFFVIYMLPVLIGSYLSYKQLKFIYYKESHRYI